MADDFIGLSELVKINDQNLADDRSISDLLQDAPLLRNLVADIASNGTKHEYLKQTGAPVVGFRSPNVGLDNDHSEDTKVSIDLKILDASFGVDKALAEAYTKGGPEAFIGREAMRQLRAAFFMAEQQFINGTNNDGSGFNGLADSLSALSDTMVVDAGGSSNLSSVYGVRSTADFDNAVAITGQDGRIDVGESVVTKLTDANGKHYTGFWTPIQGWLGLQIGSKFSVGRLANIDDGSNTVTDDLLATLLEQFPAQRMPTRWVMNRRSQRQLQQSRTATNTTGAPAPFPTEAFNIPILVDDAIGNSESAVS